MEQKRNPVTKDNPREPVIPASWWNERHLAILFVLALIATVTVHGW